eukprot:2930639-Pyramimonas_sp.AAC.1
MGSSSLRLVLIKNAPSSCPTSGTARREQRRPSHAKSRSTPSSLESQPDLQRPTATSALPVSRASGLGPH